MNSLLFIPTFIETGALKIATLDIIVLAILLIACIVGAVKGFMKQILSILGIVASIILAIVFSDDLALYFKENVPAITKIVQSIIKSLFGTILSEEYTTVEGLTAALGQSKIPSFLHGLIANLIVNSNFEVKVMDVLTSWGLTIVSFLGIIIVSSIAFAIIKLIFRFVTRIPLIRSVDKILGILFSCVKTLIVLALVCTFLSIFVNLNSFLVPGDGVECIFNKFMEFLINLPFIKDLYTTII